MKKKEELVPFDYVREEFGTFMKKISKKVGYTNSIDIIFFVLGQVVYERGEADFKKSISLIKAGVKSHQKQMKQKEARKKKGRNE